MNNAEYEQCIRREQERQARSKTVEQMKAELGLDRTQKGHTKLLRSEVVELWIDNRCKQKAKTAPRRTVPADHFIGILIINVDNKKMSDAEFREFVRNTLPVVI